MVDWHVHLHRVRGTDTLERRRGRLGTSPGGQVRDWIVPIGYVIVIALVTAGMRYAMDEPRCPEDAILVWSGRTDSHSLCVTLDDIPGTDHFYHYLWSHYPDEYPDR